MAADYPDYSDGRATGRKGTAVNGKERKMRTTYVLAAALVLSLIVSVSGQAGVVGGVHDFTDDVGSANESTWNTTGEACRVCHDPHDQGAAAYGDLGILWDHEVTTQAFQMYNESAPAGYVAFIDNAMDAEPTGVSLFCLGCHDGSVGVDEFNGGGAGTELIQTAYGAANQIGAGGSLLNTHPIGVTYDPAVDTALNPDTTAFGGKTIADFLDAGKVQCGTCHDPHDGTGFSYLLREAVDLAESAGSTPSDLCLACHNK
jgi:predicted CXXCH cytochrome family protein